MTLRVSGKSVRADMVKNIVPAFVKFVLMCQMEQLGLGHAVLFVERAVGNDPFAV